MTRAGSAIARRTGPVVRLLVLVVAVVLGHAVASTVAASAAALYDYDPPAPVARGAHGAAPAAASFTAPPASLSIDAAGARPGPARTYDQGDQLTAVTDWFGNTTAFGHDAEGNTTTITCPQSTESRQRFACQAAGWSEPQAVRCGARGRGTELLMMSFRDELLNRELVLIVSDPWELATSVAAPAHVVVTAADDDVDRGGLVLAVAEPFEYRGAKYGLLIALARRPGSLANALLQDGKAEANVYGVIGDGTPTDPFALGWWRGGLGGIATLAVPPTDGR